MSDAERSASADRQAIVGREHELAAVMGFVERELPPNLLVISGAAGIGKTTLWEAALDEARVRGFHVLLTRAHQAEVALSFAAVADLVDSVGDDVLDALPPPQLHALEVALRRRDPDDADPDRFAIAAGFAGALRVLSKRQRLVVAVDDVQWLDSSSADALLFAVRRLGSERTCFVVTRRTGAPSDFERALQPSGIDRVEVAPLSFGATGRILLDRYGPALRRRGIRRVYETSNGNPLFALELGRMLVAHGTSEFGPELAIPDLVDDLFGARVGELSEPARRALLAVSLSAGLSQSELAVIVDPLVIEDAINTGLLVIDRSGVRPTHPMLGAAVRRHSSAAERQALHRDIATAVRDPTLCARHFAIATLSPDNDLAGVVAAAAQLAASRGAVLDAEELAAHALRLTPATAPERAERILTLGRFYLRSDELQHVSELLTQRMDELPSGRERALAHLLLGDAADVPGDEAYVALAMAEAGEDPEVRALALTKRSRLLIHEMTRIDEAESLALQAMESARHVGEEVEERARQALAWACLLRGRSIDDMDPLRFLRTSRLTIRGQIHEARSLCEAPLAEAEERGDTQMVRILPQQLCEIELRAGNVIDATRLLADLDAGLPWMDKVRSRLHAVAAAVSGDSEGVVKWAAAALDETSGYVSVLDRLEVRRALGVAALVTQDLPAAVENLQFVFDHGAREHIEDPGALPVAADLVEALAMSGDVASARAATLRLRRLSAKQRHPWGTASWKRCAATVSLACRFTDAAAGMLREAADDYGTLGLQFDRSRSLLLLGGLQRRGLQRAAARESLEAAAAQFEACGSSGWAARSVAELARVSGRRAAATDELTPSERQVVDLVISGLSNKQVAGRLFINVTTVEAHLSHAYAKLGVRSRTQLARLRPPQHT